MQSFRVIEFSFCLIQFRLIKFRKRPPAGQLPVEISGFENDSCGEGAGQWRNNQVNGGSGSCTINTDLQYVKYGEKDNEYYCTVKGSLEVVKSFCKDINLVKEKITSKEDYLKITLYSSSLSSIAGL